MVCLMTMVCKNICAKNEKYYNILYDTVNMTIEASLWGNKLCETTE